MQDVFFIYLIVLSWTAEQSRRGGGWGDFREYEGTNAGLTYSFLNV